MKNSSNTQLISSNLSFESLKKRNEHGVEYWSARELQVLLGYSQWRRFENAIERAAESCKQSGNNPKNHFAGAGKMVEIGSKTERDVEDWHLSRFACYLIAQNGDPRKPEIAEAQKYFAIQTRRLDFHMPIPSSASKKKRLAMEKGEIPHTAKPDRTNLCKLAEDCLERADVLSNDSIIVSGDVQNITAHLQKL